MTGDWLEGLSKKEDWMDLLAEHHWFLAQGIAFQEEARPLPIDLDSTSRSASDCFATAHSWLTDSRKQ